MMEARRVLVIEDENGARDALGSLLAEDGYDVRTAESGRRGLACLEDFHPEAVVCDFYLPDIDGLQVLRQVRAGGGEVIFIMVTAGCGGEEAERKVREEADYFLDKPVDLSQLRRVLQGSWAGVMPAAPLLDAPNGKEPRYG
jgi:two-component system, OmpR family, response regulator